MKRLLLVLILTLSFQSWTKADDIKDLQIEGMSIGDSLLDYFSEEEIKKSKQDFQYPKDEYILYNFSSTMKLDKYDLLMIAIKKNDVKFIISGVTGGIKYDNLSNCLKLKKDFGKDVDNLFNNINNKEFKYTPEADKSGKSMIYENFYSLETGDVVTAQCMDWDKKFSKKKDLAKVFQVALNSVSYYDFVQYRAFK